MPTKVALFIPNLATAGAERVTVLLANGMAERGYSTDVVLVEKCGDFLADLANDVHVVDLKAARTVRAIPKLAMYLRKERPAALISALDYANAAALIAKRISGTRTPVITTVHAPRRNAAQYRWGLSGMVLRVCLNRYYRRAEAIVCVSRGVAEDIIQGAGVARERVRVIYNPVIHPRIYELARESIESSSFPPRQAKSLLAVGRLAPQKDYPTLLRAVQAVRQSTDVHLMILGEGNERSRLESLVKELSLESCVSMPGTVRNPYAYMARTDLLVLSSAWEALPTVLIEALALGTSIVATDCVSGPREILCGGRYGALVPPGDSAALAGAISTALAAPRPELPAEALQPYTVDYAVDEYCRLIREVARG
jgi:glycosyltransferase involved in cell wall biosynthesis